MRYKLVLIEKPRALGLLLPNLIWHVIYIFDNGGANRVHLSLKGIAVDFYSSSYENHTEAMLRNFHAIIEVLGLRKLIDLVSKVVPLWLVISFFYSSFLQGAR